MAGFISNIKFHCRCGSSDTGRHPWYGWICDDCYFCIRGMCWHTPAHVD